MVSRHGWFGGLRGLSPWSRFRVQQDPVLSKQKSSIQFVVLVLTTSEPKKIPYWVVLKKIIYLGKQ